MTNPAVEALKQIVNIMCKVTFGHMKAGEWADIVILAKNALAQAEQTPVGVSEDQFNFALQIAREFLERKLVASQEAKQAFMTDILVNRMTMAIKNVGLLASPRPSGANPPGREAGRWVSEELWLRMIDRLSDWNSKEKMQDLLEALRAAPSFPKEEL